MKALATLFGVTLVPFGLGAALLAATTVDEPGNGGVTGMFAAGIGAAAVGCAIIVLANRAKRGEPSRT